MSLATIVLLLGSGGFFLTVASGAALAMGVQGVAKDLTVLGFLGAIHLFLLGLIGGLWLVR